MFGGRLKLSAAALAIVIVVIIAGISLPLLFIDFRTVSVNEVNAVPSGGSGRIDLQVTATVGELEIVFTPMENDAVRVRSNVQGRANLFGDGSPLRVNMTSEDRTDALGSIQAVNITLNTYAPWPHYALDKVNFTIAVNENLRTSLNLSVTTGGIALTTARGVVIEGLELNSTAKGASVSLENGTVLAGNARIQTATGGSVLSWNNVTVEGSRNLTLIESSGPITARFHQYLPMGGNMNVKVADTVGEVQMSFGLGGQVSAGVVCSWNLGEPDVVDLGGFGGTAASFRSQNYPSADLFRVQVNQTLGNIHVGGRWSP
jgi:hypothetical protein